MQLWRLVAHHDCPEEFIKHYCKKGVIALGWGRIGEILATNFTNWKDISKAISEVYKDEHLNNSGAGGRSLWGLYKEMREGDLVILSNRERRKKVMQVITEEYFYENKRDHLLDTHDDYQHQRKACVKDYDPDELWEAALNMHPPNWNIRWPLFLCAKKFSL
ncbi:MAG: hypothetical protein ACREOI_15825 [bacterium]